ncbi:MAG: sugar phosphate isomerase/epimerase [Bacteroidetes bacterium]|nr:MAG: sugar phosphate isomerase/epimerase [Bacteroidota bacterium]
MKKSRRKFLRDSGLFVGAGLLGWYACSGNSGQGTAEAAVAAPAENAAGGMFFKISLAQWSLHKTLFAGELDNLDFAATARGYGLDAVEYVNQFFKDKAQDRAYLGEMKKRADDNGVRSLLIMVDGEGGLAELDENVLQQSVDNHKKWVEAAQFLGCHSIRVNAFSSSDDMEAAKAAAVEGLGRLATFAKDFGINVIVENHGGFSSNGQWLASVMQQVNMPNCGTLPDFGNFCIKRDSGRPWGGNCIEEYDRYKGVEELMPWAKGVSAKSHDFDENGNEIHTDYMRMLKIVKDAGYRGYIGIEYEGQELSEDEGIKATKALLERVGQALGT